MASEVQTSLVQALPPVHAELLVMLGAGVDAAEIAARLAVPPEALAALSDVATRKVRRLLDLDGRADSSPG